jgi:chromosome segregation ATPase
MDDSKSDEAIAKRWLYAEEKLSSSIQKFNAYVNALKGKTAEESETAGNAEQQSFNLLLKDLAVFEHSISKLRAVHKTLHRDVDSYAQQHRDLEAQISTVKNEILDLEKLLVKEQEIRRQNEDYEHVRRLINAQKSREESQREIDAEKKELSTLGAEKEAIAQEKELRRKQFGLFFQSLTMLQSNWHEAAAQSSNNQSNSAGNPVGSSTPVNAASNSNSSNNSTPSQAVPMQTG